MKRIFLLGFLLIFSSATLLSCRETEEKTVVREVEVEKKDDKVEKTEENKGILERTGEEVDKEVNEEIDKKIEDIGDDNQ